MSDHDRPSARHSQSTHDPWEYDTLPILDTIQISYEERPTPPLLTHTTASRTTPSTRSRSPWTSPVLRLATAAADLPPEPVLASQQHSQRRDRVSQSSRVDRVVLPFLPVPPLLTPIATLTTRNSETQVRRTWTSSSWTSRPYARFHNQTRRFRHQGLRAPFSCSSRTAQCGSLWSDYNDTVDPDVSAAETQFRRNIREGSAWRPGGATRTQGYLSNLCDAHTLDTVMEQSTEGTRSPLNYTRFPGLELGLYEDPTHLFSSGTSTWSAPPCNIAFASPSWNRTHHAPCAAKSPVAFVITHALETAASSTSRWLVTSAKAPKKQDSYLG